MQKLQSPLVSVVIISYNHQEFIGDLLQSIVEQKGEFNLEIVISDDASTDGTRETIEEFISTNRPHSRISFKPILGSKNIGMIPNFIRAVQEARGQYIAFAEGDDLWIRRDKLQHQLSIFEQGYGLSITDCALYSEKSHRVGSFSKLRRAIDGRESGPIQTDKLIESPFRAWHISSALMLREVVPEDLTWLRPFPIYDYAFFAMAAANCRVHYSSEEFAAYRKHSDSVTAGRPFSFSYLAQMDKMMRQLSLRIPQHRVSIRRKRISGLYFFLSDTFPLKYPIRRILALPLLLLLNPWSPYSVRDELWLLRNKINLPRNTA